MRSIPLASLAAIKDIIKNAAGEEVGYALVTYKSTGERTFEYSVATNLPDQDYYSVMKNINEDLDDEGVNMEPPISLN